MSVFMIFMFINEVVVVESHIRCAAGGHQVAAIMPGDLLEVIIPIIVVLLAHTHGVREIVASPNYSDATVSSIGALHYLEQQELKGACRFSLASQGIPGG